MQVKAISFLVAALISSNAHSVDYKYKEISDFKTLSQSNNVEEFEKHYNEYIQDCIENTYAGTASIPCNIQSEIWDRELNIQYKNLYSALSAKRQVQLQESQRIWLKERDSIFKLIESIASLETSDDFGNPKNNIGTLNYLSKSMQNDKMKYEVIKQRAMLLKSLNETYQEALKRTKSDSNF